MGRAGWLALIVGGGLLLLRLFSAADAGALSTQDQSGWLAKLGLLGFAVFILWEGFTRYRREYQSRQDWTRFASLQPVLTLVALVGGVWLWWSYFGRHHASVIWFVVVVAFIGGLRLFRDKAEKQWRQERHDEARKLPDPPTASGAANPKDFKDWS